VKRVQVRSVRPSEELRHQRNFRRLLQAVSRPGRLFRIEAAEPSGPPAAVLAIAECLLDHEVGVGVLGEGAAALAEVIAAATGARRADAAEADFIFVGGSGGNGAARTARRGRIDTPDRGATVVYSLDAAPVLDPGHFRIRLSGPGVPEPEGIAPAMREIPAAVLEELQMVNADYPLGVDAFFVRPGGEVMALPRSTRIRMR
jgi:alpha-D-ribose 1-methylphosphonate 5-triphosphate synthase subunit PhnH